jgi:hypothetical protein
VGGEQFVFAEVEPVGVGTVQRLAVTVDEGAGVDRVVEPQRAETHEGSPRGSCG